jgi:Glycosyl hydrolase family 12
MRRSVCPAGRRRLQACVAGIAVAAATAACSAAPAVTVKPLPLPSDAAWQSSAKLGLWKSAGFDVFNNEWNASAAGPQTIWAYSYRHWGVQSTQPGSTSVKTYPCVQQNFGNPRLSAVTTLLSSFAQSMPPAAASYDAEAAYDMFLNKYHGEVMVWVDNHGQTPEGGVVSQAVISGRTYDVYQGSSHMFSFVIKGKPETSGHVNLLTALRWLISHHYLTGSDVLTQVNFGWEIASTSGAPMDFNLTDFSLKTNVR